MRDPRRGPVPPFEPFCGFLERLPAAAVVVVDIIEPPSQPDGVWWLELTVNKVSTRVTWSADEGFGLFIPRQEGCNERPDFRSRDYGLAAAQFTQIVRDFASACRATAKR